MSRRKNNWQRTGQRFRQSRKTGWNRDLYRNDKDGLIAGVCAGLGDYLGLAHWIVRALFLLGLFIFEGGMVLIYVICWVITKSRPSGSTAGGSMQYEEDDDEDGLHRPVSSVRLRRAQQRLRRAMSRVEGMEAYVTSRQYELNKEFAKMEK